MSVQLLLDEFDRLCAGSDSVSSLRRLILDLAVRGALVERAESDQSAVELLDEVRSVGVFSVDHEGNRRSKTFPEISLEEVPFQVPDHWAVVRLGQVVRLINGKAFKPTDWTDGGLPIIRIGNLNDRSEPFHYCNAELPRKVHVNDGDLLICWSGTPGTSFGAHIWDRGPALLNQHIFRCEQIGKVFLPEFLKIAVNARLRELINEAHGGVGLQHVTKPKLEMLPLTLPPLAEQARIVAKVHEILVLCGQFEYAQRERELKRDALRSAALYRLTSTEITGKPNADIRFFLEAAESVIINPSDAESVSEAVLDLAVNGKLSRHARAADYERVPVRDVATLQNGYAFKSEWFKPSGVRLLRNLNVGHGKLDWSSLACLDELRAGEFDRFSLVEGDVVVSLDRPFITTGTKAAIVRGDDLPCLLLQRVGRFQLDTERIDASYLLLWVQSPWFRRQVNAGRSNGVPHISSKQVESAELLLPPIDEQRRIVAKVNEVLRVCSELKTALVSTEHKREQLWETLLRDAVNHGREVLTFMAVGG